MKKHIRICFDFFHRNKLKAFALLVIMVSASTIFLNMVANIECYNEGKRFYSRLDPERTDLITLYDDYLSYYYIGQGKLTEENATEYEQIAPNMSGGNYDGRAFQKSFIEFMKKKDVYAHIKKLPAVDKVYSFSAVDMGSVHYNNTDSDMYFADKDTYEVFNYRLSSGCWFKDFKGESKYPECVVCGPNFSGVNVGDDIEIKFLAEKKAKKIHVIGKVAAPYATYDIVGDMSQGMTYSNRVFLLNDKKSLDMFGERSLYGFPTSAFVTYKDNATDVQIQECRDYYSSIYKDAKDITLEGYVSGEDLFEALNGVIDFSIQQTFQNSMLFLGTATLMFVIISILMVKTKQNEYNIHTICGSSKKNSFLYSLFAMGFISVLAGLICSIYLMVFNYFLINDLLPESGNDFYINAVCYIALWLYLIITTAISTIVPYIMVFRKKMTLMTLYRKNK